MKRTFQFALLFSTALLFSSCIKVLLEPNIEGTWIQIDNTTDQNQLSVELTIDRSSGDVTLNGINYIHPYNNASIFVPEKAKLIAEDGQMYYKQKRADFLLIPMPGHVKHYFIDYEFEGKFLWIKEDNSGNFISPKNNNGCVFMKK